MTYIVSRVKLKLVIKMELLWIKYFMHTAETENISHTARVFMVPPSSVSASIKKLETEISANLFERTANKLKLSQSGKILYDELKKAEYHFQKAKKDILNISGKLTGEIKLLILNNRSLVTGAIAEFKEKYTEVSINIKHEISSATYNDFDIIISDKIIESNSFEKSSLVDEEVFLATSKKDPLSKLYSVEIKNIANEKFIGMPKGASIRDFADKHFSDEGVKVRYVIECDDPAYIRKYVKMGLGVTFFPYISWREQIDDSIKLVKIGAGIYRKSFIYINKTSSNSAKMFAQVLKEKSSNK